MTAPHFSWCILKDFILENSTPTPVAATGTFADLGLSPSILKTLEQLGFETPTPIQAKAIPHVLSGRDLMGLAQTGTGKTAAFGLPLIEHLFANRVAPQSKITRSLILAPTRELVNQIAEVLKNFVKRTPLKVVTAVGGASINVQINNLFRGVDVLVATPGRLLDLIERKAVRLDQAKFLVLDEADQMLDLGFIIPLKKIAKHLPKERQTMLFSATMPKEIAELSTAYLHNPVRVEVNPSGRTADKVTQHIHFVAQKDKAAKLKELLGQGVENGTGDLSLVFSRTKHGAEKILKVLLDAGYKAESIHGNKSQSQRDRAIKAFRDGVVKVLVATDVAARGIDIPGVTHVYNYDLPDVPENYVHRIGRTARAGASGIAHAFCAGDETHLLRAIERLTGITLKVVSGEKHALPREDKRAERSPRPSGFGGHRDGVKNVRRQDGFVAVPQEGEAATEPARYKDPAKRPPRAHNGAHPVNAPRAHFAKDGARETKPGGKPAFKGPRRKKPGFKANGARPTQAA